MELEYLEKKLEDIERNYSAIVNNTNLFESYPNDLDFRTKYKSEVSGIIYSKESFSIVFISHRKENGLLFKCDLDKNCNLTKFINYIKDSGFVFSQIFKEKLDKEILILSNNIEYFYDKLPGDFEYTIELNYKFDLDGNVNNIVLTFYSHINHSVIMIEANYNIKENNFLIYTTYDYVKQELFSTNYTYLKDNILLVNFIRNSLRKIGYEEIPDDIVIANNLEEFLSLILMNNI